MSQSVNYASMSQLLIILFRSLRALICSRADRVIETLSGSGLPC